MAENWIPGKAYYDGKPTKTTVSGSVHKIKNQALLIEQLGGKFVVFIVEKSNPQNVIHEVERGLTEKMEAQEVATEWMNENEDGV